MKCPICNSSRVTNYKGIIKCRKCGYEHREKENELRYKKQT